MKELPVLNSMCGRYTMDAWTDILSHVTSDSIVLGSFHPDFSSIFAKDNGALSSLLYSKDKDLEKRLQKEGVISSES